MLIEILITLFWGKKSSHPCWMAQLLFWRSEYCACHSEFPWCGRKFRQVQSPDSCQTIALYQVLHTFIL